MPTARDKRQDFLWLVSMMMHEHQATVQGWHAMAGDAVGASYKIPPWMTAREAARGFTAFYSEGPRGAGGHALCPEWMTELTEPLYEG